MPTTLAPADSSASNRVLDNALRALSNPRDYVALSAGVHAWQQLGATNDVSGTYDYLGKRVILLPGAVLRAIYVKHGSNITISGRGGLIQPDSAYATAVGASARAVSITGQSSGVHIKDIAVQPNTGTNTTAIEVSRYSTWGPKRITFSDVSVDMSLTLASYGACRGAQVVGGSVDNTQWPTDIVFERVTITQAPGDGWQISGGNEVMIDQCRVLGLQGGTTDHADGVQMIGCNGVTVQNSYFTTAGAAYPDAGGYYQALIAGHAYPADPLVRCNRVTLRNNEIYDWNGQGITIAGVDGAVITGNTVRKISTLGSAFSMSSGSGSWTNTNVNEWGNSFSSTTNEAGKYYAATAGSSAGIGWRPGYRVPLIGARQRDTAESLGYAGWTFDPAITGSGSIPTLASLQTAVVTLNRACIRGIALACTTAGAGLTNATASVYDADTGVKLATTTFVASDFHTGGMRFAQFAAPVSCPSRLVRVAFSFEGTTGPTLLRGTATIAANPAAPYAQVVQRYATGGAVSGGVHNDTPSLTTSNTAWWVGVY